MMTLQCRRSGSRDSGISGVLITVLLEGMLMLVAGEESNVTSRGNVGS